MTFQINYLNRSIPILENKLFRKTLVFGFLLFSTFYYRSFTISFSTLDWDEITYIIMGRGIMDGLIPFVDLWDIKPIGLYLIYSIFIPIFGYNTETIRILTILFTSWGAYCIFLLLEKWDFFYGIFFGFIYQISFLFLLSGMAGNTEVFFIPFILQGVYLLGFRKNFWNAVAGLFFGFAFLIKYIVIFELFLIYLLILYLNLKVDRFDNFKKQFINLISFGTILIPFALSFLIYLMLGYGTEWYNTVTLTSSKYALSSSLNQKFNFIKLFLISKSTLCLFLMTIFVALYSFIKKTHRSINLNRMNVIFFLWLIGSGIGSMWTGYFYEHYLLSLVPGFILLTGDYISYNTLKWYKYRKYLLLVVFFLALLVLGDKDRKSYKNTLENLPDTPKIIANDIRKNNWGNVFVASGMHTPYVILDQYPPVSYPQPYNYTSVSFSKKIGLDRDELIDKILNDNIELIQICDLEADDFNEKLIYKMGNKYKIVGEYFPNCRLYRNRDVEK